MIIVVRTNRKNDDNMKNNDNGVKHINSKDTEINL